MAPNTASVVFPGGEQVERGVFPGGGTITRAAGPEGEFFESRGDPLTATRKDIEGGPDPATVRDIGPVRNINRPGSDIRRELGDIAADARTQRELGGATAESTITGRETAKKIPDAKRRRQLNLRYHGPEGRITLEKDPIQKGNLLRELTALKHGTTTPFLESTQRVRDFNIFSASGVFDANQISLLKRAGIQGLSEFNAIKTALANADEIDAPAFRGEFESRRDALIKILRARRTVLARDKRRGIKIETAKEERAESREERSATSAGNTRKRQEFDIKTKKEKVIEDRRKSDRAFKLEIRKLDTANIKFASAQATAQRKDATVEQKVEAARLQENAQKISDDLIGNLTDEIDASRTIVASAKKSEISAQGNVDFYRLLARNDPDASPQPGWTNKTLFDHFSSQLKAAQDEISEQRAILDGTPREGKKDAVPGLLEKRSKLVVDSAEPKADILTPQQRVDDSVVTFWNSLMAIEDPTDSASGGKRKISPQDQDAILRSMMRTTPTLKNESTQEKRGRIAEMAQRKYKGRF